MLNLIIFISVIFIICLILYLALDSFEVIDKIFDIIEKYEEKQHVCINCLNYNTDNIGCYVPFSILFNKNGIRQYFDIVQKQNNEYVPIEIYFDHFDDTAKNLSKYEEDGDLKQIRINVKYINNIISIFGKERLLKELDKLNLYQTGKLNNNHRHTCDKFRRKKGLIF